MAKTNTKLAAGKLTPFQFMYRLAKNVLSALKKTVRSDTANDHAYWIN